MFPPVPQMQFHLHRIPSCHRIVYRDRTMRTFTKEPKKVVFWHPKKTDLYINTPRIPDLRGLTSISIHCSGTNNPISYDGIMTVLWQHYVSMKPCLWHFMTLPWHCHMTQYDVWYESYDIRWLVLMTLLSCLYFLFRFKIEKKDREKIGIENPKIFFTGWRIERESLDISSKECIP